MGTKNCPGDPFTFAPASSAALTALRFPLNTADSKYKSSGDITALVLARGITLPSVTGLKTMPNRDNNSISSATSKYERTGAEQQLASTNRHSKLETLGWPAYPLTRQGILIPHPRQS